MATIQGFHHTAIRTDEFERSVSFYTDVLGLKPRITWNHEGAQAAMIDAGDGNYIEIFERGEPAPRIETTILHFALRTDDCSGMLEQVRSAGAEITMELTDLTIQTNEGAIPVKIAFFKGPDGESIELFENAIL